MKPELWLRIFSVYGVVICAWFAYATYIGAPSPFYFLSRAATGRGGVSTFHK